ncbi:MAG: HAMP domain-containing sensor histidine kinase [Patescibacteria group bacterium]
MNLFVPVIIFIIVGGIISLVWIIARLYTDGKKIKVRERILRNDLQKAKEDLELNQQKLQASLEADEYSKLVISHLEIGIMLIDQNGLIQFVNSYAEKFIDDEQPIAKHYQKVLRWNNGENKLDFSLFEAAHQGVLQVISENNSIVCSRGAFPIAGTILPIKDGVTTGFIVLAFTDNSKQLERIKEGQVFFSAAAHELRTPISIIRANTGMILDHFETLGKEEIKRLLDSTDETSQELLDLVNNFLNLSRIEQGRLEFKKEEFDIQKLTEEVIAEQYSFALKRHLLLTSEKKDLTLRMVIGDRSKAKEVLSNLISNAIKYTQQGSITLIYASINGFIATKVCDTGMGIPENRQRLLFKSFQQIGVARTLSTSKSTGMGLFISKKLALLMHGDLVLEKSEPGSGSVFTFTLPRVYQT